MTNIPAANVTETIILGRRSVRGYRSDPVPRETVAHLLDVAARAPSGTNMQPWRVIALAGEELRAFTEGVCAAFASGEEGEGIETAYYPTPLHEPYLARRRKIGWDLYGHLGIARGEKEKMTSHLVRNLQFFSAPVGLICTIDKRLLIGSWLDYGMFLQNFITAAGARGLGTCAMAVFAEFPRTIRRLLDVDESESVVCGMALGIEDAEAPANALRTERVAADAFTDFRGFA
jgi:nitroreductase